MKKYFISIFVLSIIFSINANAQNIENVQKETTVKTVTIKDKDVQTLVQKEVSEEKSVIEVDGTDAVNQSSEKQVVKEVKSKTLDIIDEGSNKENDADLEKLKEKEVERVDGQQRGVPIQQSKEDLQSKPVKVEKSKKDDCIK